MITVPYTVFKTRVRDDSIEGENPFRWQNVTTDEIFTGKKVLIFGLPGAFTPTCTNSQLPGFEMLYDEFRNYVDEIYCISVNDAFVMYQWAKSLEIEKVKMLPDGNGEFTRKIGMLVDKSNLGFGMRSWRYAAIVDDGVFTDWYVEEGLEDNCPDDPYEISDPDAILEDIELQDALENPLFMKK